MSKPRDYYQALGLDRHASKDDIRRAYRRLAREHHPDVNRSDDAAKRFSEINEAYEVLSDPEKRKTYDQFGRAGVRAGPDAGDFGGEAFWQHFGGRDTRGGAGGAAGFDDVGDLFEQMFRGHGASPFAGQGRRARASRRGRDVERTVTVSFMTAALGGEERVQHHGKNVHVRIPAGIESGRKLRLKGKGEADPDGGPAGDLILKVEVRAHPDFRLEGLDLVIQVPVSLAEAALGTTVEVPLLKGTASIKVPPGAQSGQRLRLKGQGITNGSGQRGDFLAELQIVAPKTLSERGRELLTELADELQNPRETTRWADKGKRPT